MPVRKKKKKVPAVGKRIWKLIQGEKAHLGTPGDYLNFLCQFLLAVATVQVDVISLSVALLKNLTKGVTLFCQGLSLLGFLPGYLKGASSVDYCCVF